MGVWLVVDPQSGKPIGARSHYQKGDSTTEGSGSGSAPRQRARDSEGEEGEEEEEEEAGGKEPPAKQPPGPRKKSPREVHYARLKARWDRWGARSNSPRDVVALLASHVVLQAMTDGKEMLAAMDAQDGGLLQAARLRHGAAWGNVGSSQGSSFFTHREGANSVLSLFRNSCLIVREDGTTCNAIIVAKGPCDGVFCLVR